MTMTTEITRSAVTIRDAQDAVGDDVPGHGDVHSVTIFANQLSRDGMTVNLNGMDFTAYEKNPVVLYAHDIAGRGAAGGLPIGRTLRLTHTGDGRVRADFEFLDGDPFAERVRNAWMRGFLRGASVGWRAIETRPARQGLTITRSELLEWSIVAVPSDPDAVRDAYSRVMRSLIGDERSANDSAETLVSSASSIFPESPESPESTVIFDHMRGYMQDARGADDVDGAGDTPDFSETRRMLADLRSWASANGESAATVAASPDT